MHTLSSVYACVNALWWHWKLFQLKNVLLMTDSNVPQGSWTSQIALDDVNALKTLGEGTPVPRPLSNKHNSQGDCPSFVSSRKPSFLTDKMFVEITAVCSLITISQVKKIIYSWKPFFSLCNPPEKNLPLAPWCSCTKTINDKNQE